MFAADELRPGRVFGGKTSRLSAVFAAILLAAGMTLAPTAASAAGVVTEISFLDSEPKIVDFGSRWLFVLAVESVYPDGPRVRLTSTEGTVDVYLSGVAGAYAKDLPIQPDGKVYFTQQASKPLLGAGTYDVSAIYNPPSGGYFATSQTTTQSSLTVTALTVEPTVQVDNNPAVSARPVITGILAGTYVTASGGAPAGTWNFAVRGPAAEPVFEVEVAQAAGETEPLRVEVTSTLEKGFQYSVTSTFTPAAEIASGLTVAEIPDSTFVTLAGTFGESLGAAVPLPLWALAMLLVLLAGLITTAVILGVRLSRSAGSQAPLDPRESSGTSRFPGDPLSFELMSVEEAGIPQVDTRAIPASTTWLLSEFEPATGLESPPEFAIGDSPTERIGTVATDNSNDEPGAKPSV